VEYNSQKLQLSKKIRENLLNHCHSRPIFSRQQIMTHHEYHDNQRPIQKSFSFPKSVPIRSTQRFSVQYPRPITLASASQRQQPKANSLNPKKATPSREWLPS
jgi:hypothetical protein